jgi:hypothetical protein
MKKFLLIGAFIAPFFVSGQTIYDNLDSVPMQPKTQILFQVQGSGFVLTRAQVCPALINSGTTTSVYENCVITAEAPTVIVTRYDRVTMVFNPETNSLERGVIATLQFNAWGQNVTLQVCETGSNTFKHQEQCYDPFLLEQADSCGVDSGDILPRSGTMADICRVKQDGSQCLYESAFSDDGSPFFTPKIEPSSCYDNPIANLWVDSTDSLPPPTDDECINIDNASWMCPESEVSSTNDAGVVKSGCGTFSFDGSPSTFVCFRQDSNFDGILSPEERDRQTAPVNPEEPVDPVNPVNPELPTDPNATQTNNLLTSLINQSIRNETATNGVSTAVDGVRTATDSVKTSVDGLGQGIDGIGQSVDELTGVAVNIRDELRGDGVTGLSGEPSAGLTGFYTPIYENGFAGIWTEKQELFAQTPVVAWVESWRVSVNGDYQFPEFCANVIHDFGCHSFNIDDRAFPFIRIVLILTALMYARRLVTGG